MNLTETRIKITGPNDLIATVPMLLGFHPEHSLVAVGLTRRELRCTFRVDLPGSIDHLEHLRDFTAQLCRNECEETVLIAYGEREVAEAALERTAARLHAAGIVPLDRLRITAGRWFNLGCDEPCCPAQGLDVPLTSPASCEVALSGGAALPDRAAVTALFDPAEPDRRAAVAEAVTAALRTESGMDWAAQRSRDLSAVDHWMGVPELPGIEAIATLGLALGDLDIRDYTLNLIDSSRFGQNRMDLWIWLARHLDEDLAAPAATLAGFAAYRLGNGVLALEALELALRNRPDYRLAQLLLTALQAGVPPTIIAGLGRRAASEAAHG